MHLPFRCSGTGQLSCRDLIASVSIRSKASPVRSDIPLRFSSDNEGRPIHTSNADFAMPTNTTRYASPNPISNRSLIDGQCEWLLCMSRVRHRIIVDATHPSCKVPDSQTHRHSRRDLHRYDARVFALGYGTVDTLVLYLERRLH